MIQTLTHRGPDSGDIWQDPDVPLLLAHRRLAILDLSPKGCQPMRSASGRYLIVYNGEIYNYLELQKDLRKAGYTFRGRSDTEVILSAVEHWGLNQTLQKISGQFAFALWDREERQLHLARDRLGKKPLYVGRAGKTLIFGSELKALRAHPDFKPQICKNALAAFVRTGYVPAPHCIYEGVLSLPAGHRLSLNTEKQGEPAGLQRLMAPYWSHLRALDDARAHMDRRKDADLIDDFERLLQTCVSERLVSDVPLGAFLSGGVDSSAVVALMQAASPHPVKTYTVGFQEDGFNEAAYAAKVAAHLETDHHEMILNGKDALETIPLLPDIYDEPFADISAIPTYLVSKFAQKDVSVALSGDGGDEMLGGYTRHIAGPRLWRRMKMMPRPLRRLLASAIQSIPPEYWDTLKTNKPQFGTAMHKAASVLTQSSQEDIYRQLTSQWREPPLLHKGEALSLAGEPEWQPEGLSFAEKMMYWDTLSYLPNNILTKVDRASMAVSLEVRAPLLDKRIYEYVWALPPSLKIREKTGKWLLRQVLKRHVPAELFNRPKQGFSIPLDAWLRGPLKDWAEGLLDRHKLEQQGFLDAETIRKTWDAHLSGRGNHATALWTVLMFQAWHERWMCGKKTP